MNLAAQIALATRQFPDRIALSDAESSLTYSVLEQRAGAIAAHLLDAGLTPGDRVAAFLPNSADYVVLLYAVLRAGGIFVPLNYRFAERELQSALHDSGSRFLAVEERDLERALPALSGTDVRHLLVRSAGAVSLPHPGQLGVSLLSDIYRDGARWDAKIAPRRDDDDALLMYTSGTTGRPKGVRQTHRNNTASVDMVMSAWQLSAEDRLLQALPLFHVGGLQCSTLPALAVGARTHFLIRWDAGAWLAALDALRPTFSGLVTTMLIDVLSRLEGGVRPELPASLRFCVFGGSATPAHVPRRFEELLGVPLVELYGQTETTGLITTYDVGERRVPGSMGRLRTEVADAMLLAPDGAEVPLQEGATGEIAFAGDTVTAGYWQREAETESRRHGRFLRTGDVVRIGADGYLHYLDRADNMIVTGGENVYPAEVEAVLARHPKVAEVAVIGAPHERLVQQVTAIVVPLDDSVRVEDILSFVGADPSLAPYKRPRRIEFATALPKTGSGKIDRSRLKATYAPPQTPAGDEPAGA